MQSLIFLNAVKTFTGQKTEKMSKTSIEWCARPGTIPETWNPTTGCNKKSQGCKFCYAEIMHKRLRAMRQEKYKQPFLAGAVEHHDYDLLTMPLRWNKPRTVFVNSMSDLFHEKISFGFIDQVFAIMALAVDHTFIIVTKRADMMYNYFTAGKDALIERWGQATHEIGDEEDTGWKGINYDGDESYAECWISNVIPQRWPLPNVWLLVSAEDQQNADERIPLLLQTPAAVRGLSCEPLLGTINLTQFYISEDKTITHNILTGVPYDWDYEQEFPENRIDEKIDWVICGGESGHKARPMHPEWARSLRDQCKNANVAFFFKQWGEYVSVSEVAGPGDHYKFPDGATVRKTGKKLAGRKLDGKEYNQFPDPKL
jgi:protein gp37